jgi:Tol biopolymer transport system component
MPCALAPSAWQPGETKERDLSWQDWTVPYDISEDGKLMLFVEAGEAGGGEYAVFTRDTSGTSAVRLGPGSPNALSPDGKWALVLRQNMSPPDFTLLPTGVGQQRILSTGNVAPRVYVMNLDAGQPRPITPEGFRLGRAQSVSPDGKHVATVTSGGIALVSVEGGEPQLVRGSQSGDPPLRWAKDGNGLFVGRRTETACAVSRLDLQTGTRTPWKTFSPADLAGVTSVACPRIAADEQHCVFGYIRNFVSRGTPQVGKYPE